VVNGIKASATKRWREQSSRADLHLWQPSFYDRVVRSERELAALRKYIIENPMRALARSRAGS
jgi:hypothetical protein